MSVVGRGAFSLTSTPKADRNTKRPPLPLSQGGTPNGKWNPTASAISYTHTKASTPGSSNAKAAQERLVHELETRLYQTDQKLVDAKSKLTECNLELSRLRAAAEKHGEELSYRQRLLEREQRERGKMEVELQSAKESLRTANQTTAILRASGPASGTMVNGHGVALHQPERVMMLQAQLEEAMERSSSLASEMELLKEEKASMADALSAKGEAGSLLKELTRVKEERVRLALELHEAKQIATRSKGEAAEALRQMRAVDSLRDSLAESSAGMAAARSEVDRLTRERSMTLEEHGALLNQAKVRAQHAQHT